MEKYGIELALKALACHWIPSFEGMTIARITWLFIPSSLPRRQQSSARERFQSWIIEKYGIDNGVPLGPPPSLRMTIRAFAENDVRGATGYLPSQV